MVYQELVDFARGAFSLGYEADDVAQELIGAGWKKQDVQEALAVAANLGSKEFTKAQLEAGDFDEGKELEQAERRKAQEMSSILDVVRVGGEESSRFPTMAAWFTCITNPVTTFHRARYHAGHLKSALGFGPPPVAIGLLVLALSYAGAVGFLSNAGLLADLPTGAIANADAALRQADLAAAAVFLAALFAASAATGFANSLALHAIARALGGKATFKQQAFALSIANAGSLALIVPATPFALAAFVGLATGAPLSVVTIAASLIAIALLVHASVILPAFAVREAQSISIGRAFLAVWLVPLVAAMAFVIYAMLS